MNKYFLNDVEISRMLTAYQLTGNREYLEEANFLIKEIMEQMEYEYRNDPEWR